ncbi:MAG: flagellar motor protein MotB [Bdellovibrionota bacterium]
MPKKHPEHVNLERWLVSYADFITLLFAFFVILYATSKVDAQKFKAVADSLKAAFTSDFVDAGGKSGGKTLNQFEQDNPTGGLIVDMPVGRSNIMTHDYGELKRLADILEESVSYELGVSDIAEKMQIIYEDRGLVVRLSAKDFFEPGSAQVKSDALPMLDQMAKVLKTVRRHIRVEGHTDNTKISSEYYPSNWELSTARAAWIIRYFIQKFKFDPRYLEASGYAEYHPIATNKEEEGRKRNRRVEIVVLGRDPR